MKRRTWEVLEESELKDLVELAKLIRVCCWALGVVLVVAATCSLAIKIMG